MPFLKYCLFLLPSLLTSQVLHPDDKAKVIVEQAIEAHGGEKFSHLDVSFDFRATQYQIHQDKGVFQYSRTFKDTAQNNITDILNNKGLTRTINNKKTTLSDKDISRYTNAVNSVVYFVLLPYKLKDPAVHVAYVGENTLEGKQYDKVKVWFSKEGGGNDFEDIYCYWFNKESHTLDYLAYTNGGPRFRKATKRQKVNGITIQDYDNYEITDTSVTATDYDKAFAAGKAKLLTTIEQTNIVVK